MSFFTKKSIVFLHNNLPINNIKKLRIYKIQIIEFLFIVLQLNI